MRKMGTIALTLALACLALGSVAGSAEAATLRIGIHRQAFGSMDVVAWKKGYFDEYLGKDNYSVHFFSQGKLMNQAMLSGSLDTGTTGFVPWTIGTAKGGKLVGFGATAHLCSLTRLMVPLDSPIKRVEDLKGKSVATAKGASDTFTFENFILPAHGLNVKDIRIINSTNTERLPMLRARNVDVIVINEPTATIAEAQGYARTLVPDFCKYDVAAMMSIVHPKTLEEHRQQVVNYIRAWLKAAAYYQDNFDDYVKIYHAHEVSQGAKVAVETTRNALKKLVIAPELTPDMIKHLETVATILKEQGQVPRVPDFTEKLENLDLRLLEEAKQGAR